MQLHAQLGGHGLEAGAGERLDADQLARARELRDQRRQRAVDALWSRNGAAGAPVLQGLAAASQRGAVGTTLMLLESSRVGARIDVGAIPCPPGVPRLRCLQPFPSCGFALSVRPWHAAAVLARFVGRGIAAAHVGEVTASQQVHLAERVDAFVGMGHLPRQ